MGNPIALPEIYKAAFEDFVIPSYETAPYTTVQNRAQVIRSLKAIAGIERIHVKGLNLLQDEFGPAGEKVYEADNKDSRIRFIGANWISGSTTNGSIIYSEGNITDYVEVTFYGTGLNYLFSRNDLRDIRVSVDGGAEGGNIVSGSPSTILSARNYSPNIILNLVSGLSLGWHTVKLRNNNATAGQNINLHGFEILNERADLAVYSGTGISNGSTQGISALATSNFNAGVVGTRGARVIKYIQDGEISQTVQEVDATTKYLTNTDHTNEEVVRRINFREFGANRVDDFSTLAGVAGDKAFTLGDGTTSLVGNDVQQFTDLGIDGFFHTASGSYHMITFIGTGLDIDIFRSVALTSSTTYQIWVDGLEITSGATAADSLFGMTSSTYKKFKICSGLPYGTHVVKIQRTVFGSIGPNFSDFYIYQPKKPSIPSGALEIADYNVLASFSGRTFNANSDVLSTGIMRKMTTRETAYTGTWVGPTLAIGYPSGFNINTVTAASYVEYVFCGTGIDLNFLNNNGAQSYTVSLDGSTNFTGLTTSFSATAGLTFTAATGVITGSPATPNIFNSLQVTGLSFGKHTIRITQTSGVGFYPASFDIITPIHINNSTLKIGSQSLKSITKYSPEKIVSNTGPDLSKAKAWVLYDTTTNTILRSYNVSAVLETAVGSIIVYLEKPFKTKEYVIQATASAAIAAIPNASRYPNQFGVNFANDAGTSSEVTYSAILCFGELIDE